MENHLQTHYLIWNIHGRQLVTMLVGVIRYMEAQFLVVSYFIANFWGDVDVKFCNCQ